MGPRFARDVRHRLKSVRGRVASGSGRGLEKARAPVLVAPGGEGRDERAERIEVRQRRVLRAVERIEERLAPAARRRIDEVRRVSGGDLQSERIAGDRLALEEARVGERRGDRGEFVDDDLRRRVFPEHRQEVEPLGVASGLVDGRRAAGGDKIEARRAAGRRVDRDCEPAVGVGLNLRQPRRRIRARRPETDCRARDRAAADLHLSFDADRGVGCAGCKTLRPKDRKGQGASPDPLLHPLHDASNLLH